MAYYNTIIGQMVRIFSRHEFQKAVLETKTEYHLKRASIHGIIL